MKDHPLTSPIRKTLLFLLLSISATPLFSQENQLSALSATIPELPFPCIYIEDLAKHSLFRSSLPIARKKSYTIHKNPSYFIKTWPVHHKYANSLKQAIALGFYDNFPHLHYCVIDQDHNVRGYIMGVLRRKHFRLTRDRMEHKKSRISSADKQIEEYQDVLNFLIERFQKTHLIYLDFAERNLMFDHEGKLTLIDLEVVVHPEELLSSKKGLINHFYIQLPVEYREVIEKEYPFLKAY